METSGIADLAGEVIAQLKRSDAAARRPLSLQKRVFYHYGSQNTTFSLVATLSIDTTATASFVLEADGCDAMSCATLDVAAKLFSAALVHKHAVAVQVSLIQTSIGSNGQPPKSTPFATLYAEDRANGEPPALDLERIHDWVTTYLRATYVHTASKAPTRHEVQPTLAAGAVQPGVSLL